MPRLNWLATHTLPGDILLQSWLLEHGISYSLTQRYVQSGWLNRLSSGVFFRPGADADMQPDWKNALLAVQEQQALPVHLAGLSSLAYQGLSHYLQLGQEQIWLGIKGKQALPKWFKNFSGQNWIFCSNSKLELLPDQDLKKIPVEGKELMASTAELAAYEIVDAIGKHISFEHAAELFQGLVGLSPRKIQSLLERSHAVQTNRIFLFLARHHGHQWVNRLDESKIELGRGKRQVVKGGVYDEQYQITVPATLGKPNE